MGVKVRPELGMGWEVHGALGLKAAELVGSSLGHRRSACGAEQGEGPG